MKLANASSDAGYAELRGKNMRLLCVQQKSRKWMKEIDQSLLGLKLSH
jgi:hypothetical protein